MANPSITYTFASNTVADASEVNTNFANLVNYISDRNAGTTTWDRLYVTNASDIPLIVNNSSGTQNIAEFRDNGTAVVSILNGGNVGIGNGAPQSKLHVGPGTDAPSTSNCLLHVTGAGTTSMAVRDSTNNVELGLYADGNGTLVFTPTNHALKFGTNNAEVARFDTSGNFGVGTTGGLSKLSVNGGLHVGGDSDAGDNNLLVDGTITGSFAAYGSAAATFCISDSGVIKTRTAAQVASDIGITTNPAARAYLSATQTVTTGTTVKVAFNTESFDITSNFDTTNNKFTVPSAGRYLIVVHILMDIINVANLGCHIYVNNFSVSQHLHDNATANDQSFDFTDILNLSANDYIEIFFNNNTGADIGLFGGYSYFSYVAINKLY
jgi:hypothetical protein